MNEDNDKKIKFENDILKAKLTAEFGMEDANSQLEPEMENEWLNYIYEWETQFAKQKTIKVYDFIGNPEFRKIDEMKEHEISGELERLITIMHENNISLDFICDYDDHIIYKFITEELFEEEINDIRIKGMFTCFTYEEFYPNHDYDIKERSEEIIEGLFGKKTFYEGITEYYFSDVIIYNDNSFASPDFHKILYEIYESLTDANLSGIKIERSEFDISIKKASVRGKINYELNDVPKTASFIFGLSYNDFYWDISEFSLEF